MSERSSAGVTPVVLCRDEEANLGRTLDSLRWARRVVVVDSGSTDRSREIVSTFPNAVWFERPFDTFGNQWTFAIRGTGIDTPFVLSLDADMVVPEDLANEVRDLASRADVDAAHVPVTYCVRGVPLRGSLYPSQIRFFRPEKARVVDVGHGHDYEVSGRVVRCRSRLLHDDRKTLERFVAAQLRYSAIEAAELRGGGGRGVADAVRRRVALAPFLAWSVAYLRAGGPFRGAAARRYAAERLIFEALLRYRLDDGDLEAARAGTGDEAT